MRSPIRSLFDPPGVMYSSFARRVQPSSAPTFCRRTTGVPPMRSSSVGYSGATAAKRNAQGASQTCRLARRWKRPASLSSCLESSSSRRASSRLRSWRRLWPSRQTSDKRIGQILVEMGLVSRPDLGTMLAEQLGVELAKQEGFGAGLWSEIKRRHPRGRPDRRGNEAPELAGPLVDAGAPDSRPSTSLTSDGEAEPDELESFRQQLAFASTGSRRSARPTRERSACSRRSAGSWQAGAEEIDDWRERAMRAEDSRENTKAAADLAELEATAAELRAELVAREQELAERIASEALVQSLSEQVEVLRVKSDEAWGLLEGAHTEARALDGTVTALRAELEAREGELAAGVEVRSQLAAEAGRLEDELNALRDQHSGSKDAIAALTAQVDELRAGGAEAQRLRGRGARRGGCPGRGGRRAPVRAGQGPRRRQPVACRLHDPHGAARHGARLA